MSIKYIAAALNFKTGSTTKKAILIKLADNANDDGYCWPSYSNIALQCECSKSTVMRAISQMVDSGILSKIERKRDNGSLTSNGYFLNIIGCQNDTRGSSTVTPGWCQNDTRGSSTVTPGWCQNDTRGSSTVTPPEPSLEPLIETSLRMKQLLSSSSKNDESNLNKNPNDYPGYQKAVSEWNDFATDVGIPCIAKVTSSRSKKIDTAYKNYKKLRTELNDGNPNPKPIMDKTQFVEALVNVCKSQITQFHIDMPITFDYLLDKKRVDRITESGVFR